MFSVFKQYQQRQQQHQAKEKVSNSNAFERQMEEVLLQAMWIILPILIAHAHTVRCN